MLFEAVRAFVGQGSKPVQRNLQAAQATFIRRRQIACPDIDLNGRNQQGRNPEGGIAGGSHVDETLQVDAVIDMNIPRALLTHCG